LCFGVATSLFVGSTATISSPWYFPAASIGLGVAGAIISAR
jgi:pyruvate dehydrogenase complex dehydrogenase (E1) component